MKSNAKSEGLFEMDRVARVLTWFAGAIMIFILGMVFMQAINADSIQSTTTDTTTTTN